MASVSLIARSPLAEVLMPGRYGASINGGAGVAIIERSGYAIAHVAARRGAADEVAGKLSAMPTLVSLAPAEWLVIAEDDAASSLAAELADTLGSAGAVIDLSSAKSILRLAGPRARDVLAKGCPLDLDAGIFRTGDAATTIIAQISCTLRQASDEPGYDLIVPRSLAQSFYAWLTAAAAEYGYEVR